MWTIILLAITEDESRISDLQRHLREEKQSRKSVETSLFQLQEEMGDLQAAKATLEKVGACFLAAFKTLPYFEHITYWYDLEMSPNSTLQVSKVWLEMVNWF